jgi:hypothetical protein
MQEQDLLFLVSVRLGPRAAAPRLQAKARPYVFREPLLRAACRCSHIHARARPSVVKKPVLKMNIVKDCDSCYNLSRV